MGALLAVAREDAQEWGRVRDETWEAALAAGWTDADLLEAGRPRAVTMYETEQIEFRRQDQQVFYDRLRRNGPRAYDEFKRAEEFLRQQPNG